MTAGNNRSRSQVLGPVPPLEIVEVGTSGSCVVTAPQLDMIIGA